MYEDNSFITLTYSDQNLTSPKLQYRDFQLFVKRLRKHIYETTPNYNKETHRIGVFVTGEYGDKNKRPHWHAILFNFRFADEVYSRTTDLGDRIFTSRTLDELWGFNDPATKPNEIGRVTFESAGYVARYATKKLAHGRDGVHDYEPISRRSSKNAIGKRWLERNWRDVFLLGKCRVAKSDGSSVETPIPRYYEKWLKSQLPDEWERYVTTTKVNICEQAAAKEAATTLEEKKQHQLAAARQGYRMKARRTRREAHAIILEQKTQNALKFLKNT